MTAKFRQFIFEDYTFDTDSGVLTLRYGFDDALHFSETFRFDFTPATYDSAALDRAIQNLFFMAGVSYYKAYLAPEIVIQKGTLDPAAAAFFSKTYQRGLGEFFYVNHMDPRTPIAFKPNAGPDAQPKPDIDAGPLNKDRGHGMLVAIGGGKDSLVSIELLRAAGQDLDLATWSVNHRSQLEPLVERIGLPHYFVEREWDAQLFDLNKQDAYNGHIPISAIFGCVGAIVAILSGRRDVVMSNEQSANEATLMYQGVDINHQYSKSQEFEQDFQTLLDGQFGDRIRYYSFLRPLSELRIAELFAHIGFDTYHDVFSSCNRAFVHSSDHIFWDGTCSKCAFVFLALTPWVPRPKLEALFSGKNLLLTPDLESTYRQLLGIEGDKPLECVGEVKESRAAMRLAVHTYPELADTYTFSIPDSYDYRAIFSDHMPAEVRTILRNALTGRLVGGRSG